MFFLWLALVTSPAAADSFPLIPSTGKEIKLHGISFLKSDPPRNLVPGIYPTNVTLSAVVLAGMTTAMPEASDRWGMSEPANALQGRLFIGDRIGRVIVRYQDDTLEQIPILFGVNVWPYELFTTTQPDEAGLLTSHALKNGPYREPFASDTNAAKLFTASLRTLDNPDALKPFRYLMGIRVKSVPLKSIELIDEGLRKAGWQVGAISGLAPGTLPPDGLELLDESFFVRQRHLPAMEALAKRLYQFEDLLPTNLLPPAASAGYPHLEFSGPAEAAILAHVFAANVSDLIENKIASDGRLRSSSPSAPSFGGYIGMGTWREAAGNYSRQSWSRDAGPALRELIALGRDQEARSVGETLLRYLYDEDFRHHRPNWKRVINSTEIGESEKRKNQRAENDGHAAIMLAMAQLATSPATDSAWLDQHWKAFTDAGNWFPWQMDHPEVSAFDGLLYNESESSGGGGRDLYSNSQAALALRAFAILAERRGDNSLASEWNQKASLLEKAIRERLTLEATPNDPLSPRYIDTDSLFDSWAYGWKRMSPLLASSDLRGFTPVQNADESLRLNHTYDQLRGNQNSLLDAGRMMGYGQAYLAQSALMLDRTRDATRAVERAAAFCYHPDHPYLVPEGVIVHPKGSHWFRNGDLGNLMQQVEILKMIRLLPGIDDRSSTAGLTLIPRLPDGWSRIEVSKWPIRVLGKEGGWERAFIQFTYQRMSDNSYHLQLRCDRSLPIAAVRIGPFTEKGGDTYRDPAKSWRWVKEGEGWFLYAEQFDRPLKELEIRYTRERSESHLLEVKIGQ